MNVALKYEAALNAAGPLAELLETYGQCLSLSREYVTTGAALEGGEVDTDRLEDFLNARAELFAVAENSFVALSGSVSADVADEASRRELTGRVKALLEEMTEVENQLAAFLGDRLARMRDTINKMQRAQPVFKRYGHLGGDKIVPSRIDHRS